MINPYIDNHARCKGCGVCAGGCPTGALSMGLGPYGDYQPTIDHDRCVGCCRCARVCPVEEQRSTFTASDLTADYTECFVAHTEDAALRRLCSSGGVTTQILIDLLETREIDYCIAVKASRGGAIPFEPIICRTVDGLLESRGSKYYPVEFSAVLRQVKETHGACAVVCLPCVASALRKLQKEDKAFNNIKYIICLTCGHNKTVNYTNFLIEHYGLTSPVTDISFRNKGNYPFSQFALQMIGGNGKKLNEKFDNGIINRLWSGFYFAQRGCLHCRDIFGCNADISCMDAWMSPYNNSKNGYNFVLAKKSSLHLLDGQTIRKKRITIDEVIKSQWAIFERKLSGNLPQELLDNLIASETYLDQKLSQDFILKRFVSNLSTMEKFKDTLNLRKIYYKFRYNLNTRINDYENLISR